MKTIYKRVDNSKINDRNINSVLEQFNQWSMQETVKTIKNKNKSKSRRRSQSSSSESDPQISQLKLEREKFVSGNRDLRFMERPEYTNRNMFKKGNNTDRNNFKSNSL